MLSSSISKSSSVLSSFISESSDWLLDLPPLLTSSGLRVAHLNCRSLLASAEEVYDMYIHNSIDIFAVTDQEVFLFSPHINIVQNDHNHHDGGVAFILSDWVKYVLSPDLTLSFCGLSCFQLLNNQCYSAVFILNMTFSVPFLAECEIAHLQCLRIAIFGDVNADLLKPCYPCTKLLLSVTKQLQLVDLVCVPTRVTMDSSSQIDVLLTTDDECFKSTKVFPFTGSDHHLIVSHYYSRVCVLILHPIELLRSGIFRSLILLCWIHFSLVMIFGVYENLIMFGLF